MPEHEPDHRRNKYYPSAVVIRHAAAVAVLRLANIAAGETRRGFRVLVFGAGKSLGAILGGLLGLAGFERAVNPDALLLTLFDLGAPEDFDGEREKEDAREEHHPPFGPPAKF